MKNKITKTKNSSVNNFYCLGQDCERLKSICIIFFMIITASTITGQTTFTNPVGINITPAAGIDFHVNGQVRFQGLTTSTTNTRFLSLDGSNNVQSQSGSLLPSGTLFGQSLYWNGTAWQPNSLLLIDPTLNFMGIGTTTPPNEKLQINSIAGNNYLRFTNGGAPLGARLGQNGSNIFEIRQEENADMQFYTNATQRMVLNANGFLGLNTLTPTAHLHVNGQVRFQSLAPSPGLNNFLAMDGTGNIFQQTGSLVNTGTTPGQTLYWDGSNWLNNDYLHIDPSLNFVRIGQPAGQGNLNIVNTSGTSSQALSVNDGSGSGNDFLYVRADGFVGVGTNSAVMPAGGINYVGPNIGFNPPWQNSGTPLTNILLSVNGDITTSSDYFGRNIYITSDERIKENISPISNWKRILDIKSYTYHLKAQKDEIQSFGFIAQEVHEILPELTTIKENLGAVNYVGFIPFLTQGLKDHEERISSIEKNTFSTQVSEQKLDDLNKELQDLKQINSNLLNDNNILKAEFETLKDRLDNICSIPCLNKPQDNNIEGNNSKRVLKDVPSLYQNEPNPFNENNDTLLPT